MKKLTKILIPTVSVVLVAGITTGAILFFKHNDSSQTATTGSSQTVATDASQTTFDPVGAWSAEYECLAGTCTRTVVINEDGSCEDTYYKDYTCTWTKNSNSTLKISYAYNDRESSSLDSSVIATYKNGKLNIERIDLEKL